MKTPLLYALFVALLSGAPSTHPPSRNPIGASVQADKASEIAKPIFPKIDGKTAADSTHCQDDKSDNC